MDEFKSEDELRPDSSDRRPPRQRKGPAVTKVAMSKQHLMIGIGILVLLLLVIGIGSALKSPVRPEQADGQAPGTGQKNIDLSGSTGGDNGGTPAPAQDNANSNPSPNADTGSAQAPIGGTVNGSNVNNGAPQTLNPPAVSPTPSAPAAQAPAGQHRIDLPGNMADALSQQGDRVNGMTQHMNGDQPSSTLPTAPATVAPAVPAAKEPAHRAPAKPAPHKAQPKQTPMVQSAGSRPAAKAPAVAEHTPAAKAPAVVGHTTAAPAAHVAPPSAAPAHVGGSIQTAPAGYYTLQLSSASQATTLNAYAKKQQLGQYWVYETKRDGKPWYVLVSGVYASPAQAKSALSQLPADIQAKKPWARQIGQVKQDQNK